MESGNVEKTAFWNSKYSFCYNCAIMSAQQEIRIVHRPEAYGSPSYVTLEYFLGNNSCGSLVYYRSVSGGYCELEGLNVGEDVQRMEIGKALLQDFAIRVGAGQLVRAVIFNEDTVGMLAQKYKAAGVTGRYSVPKEELGELPFVRILDSGNIGVETIIVTPEPVDSKDPYEIVLWGRTR